MRGTEPAYAIVCIACNLHDAIRAMAEAAWLECPGWWLGSEHGLEDRACGHPGDRRRPGEGLLRRAGGVPRRPRPPGQRGAAVRAAHPARIGLLGGARHRDYADA